MLASIAGMFYPSRRKALRRVIGFSILAGFFVLWALCGHAAPIASLAIFPTFPALYYVLVFWHRGWADRRKLAWAYQAAEDEAVAAPAAVGRNRGLRVPKKLD